MDQINGLVWFLNHPLTQPAESWQAKLLPVFFNPWILLGFARPVGSNLEFFFPGFSLYGHILIF
jgi:hypothetical protein